MLRVAYTAKFQRDVKRLKKKRYDLGPREALIDLVAQNTPEALEELRRRHNMPDLKGEWSGSRECHVANAGDWLVIRRDEDTFVTFQRTGSHDDLLR